ncbi:MAG: glycosyltransferase family 4 protein [Patescibacteria group bacterium]|nr:glycosyltransferase family 4 protein [Patescibacteria group bacterium]
MKILWYAKNHSIGGDFIYSQEVVRKLKSFGHEVYWVGFKEDFKCLADGVFTLPFYFRRPLFTIGKGPKRIREILLDLKPDVVHANLAFSTDDFALVNVCRTLKIPLVITFHAPFNDSNSFWGIITRLGYIFYSRFFSKANAVIIFSEPQKKYLVRYGVPKEKVHIVFNGVDTDKYKPGRQAYKESLGAKLIILYCGRLETGKNARILVEAFKELNLPEKVKLVVVGGGLEESSLRKLGEKDKNIIFTGYISDESRKIEIIQGSDIFVLPSEAEGMSLSLLEAMSCGLVPVTSNIISNMTVTGQAGLSVDLNNLKEDLKKVLLTLVKDEEKRKSMGELARERVVTNFSLDGNVHELISIYNKLKEEK